MNDPTRNSKPITIGRRKFLATAAAAPPLAAASRADAAGPDLSAGAARIL